MKEFHELKVAYEKELGTFGESIESFINGVIIDPDTDARYCEACHWFEYEIEFIYDSELHLYTCGQNEGCR